MKIDTTIAVIIFASLASSPQANAQAPIGDFGPAPNRKIQIVDDGPVVHDYRQAPKLVAPTKADAYAEKVYFGKRQDEGSLAANRLNGVRVIGQYSHPSFFIDHQDYEWAYRRSEWVGICSYLGYEKRGQIDYFNPPTAIFHPIKRLKGPPMPIEIPINFKFYDHSDAQMPEGWKFTEDKMPPLKSQWIIFIPVAAPSPDNEFYTYDGCYGRQIATEENIDRLNTVIEGHRVGTQQGLGSPDCEHHRRASGPQAPQGSAIYSAGYSQGYTPGVYDSTGGIQSAPLYDAVSTTKRARSQIQQQK